MSTLIDLGFRPDSYCLQPDSPDRLLLQIRGSLLRSKLRDLIREGGHERVRSIVTGNPLLLEQTVKTLERVDPRYMGGNYLPEMEHGEVEIGRIAIASTTHDVVAEKVPVMRAALTVLLRHLAQALPPSTSASLL